MKRINGYLQIGDFKKIDKKIEKSMFAKFWLTDGKKEYLFKKLNILLAYKELFYSQIIKELGLSSVKNDLAVRGKQFGIISENYNPNNYPVFSINKIVNDYWDDLIEKIEKDQLFELSPTISYEHDYNLENLPNILKWFFSHNGLIYDSSIEEGLILQFIIQILLGNSDLRAPNIEIYVDGIPKFSPYYDFNHYGTVNIENSMYCFLHHARQSKGKEVAKTTIENFIKTEKRKNIEQLKKYLEKTKELNLDFILNGIKEHTKAIVSEEIQLLLKKELVENLKNVDSIIKGNFR